MPGPLTPLIMMAAEGLLNDGLAANTALEIKPLLDLNSYTSQPIVADYTSTITALESDLFDGGLNPDGISQGTIDSFIHALDNTTPFLSSVTPPTGGVSSALFTTLLDQHITNLFPSNGQYVQYLQIALGQKDTANKYVNSAINGAKLAEQTFTSTDALMSGNLTAVSTSINLWGAELVATGSLFNFAKLDNIGTPQALIETLIKVNMLSAIADELDTQGIDMFELQKAINNNQDIVLKPNLQKRCYDAFLQVTGAQLDEILSVLQFETTGITVLAELLDLVKVFPTSFQSITAPNEGTLENIYVNAEGDIAAYVDALTTQPTPYMPDVQAKANHAFCISLVQIKGISNSTPQQIGAAASSIENNEGLAETGSLTEALPTATTEFFVADMGGGTGPDGTFYLTDLVGAPAGLPFNTNITIMNTVIDLLETDVALADMEEILLRMRNVISLTYEDAGFEPQLTIPAGFGAGTYASRNAAITALNAELNTAALVIIAAYPTETADANAAFISLISNVTTGVRQLWDAEVRFEITHVVDYETLDPAQNGIPYNKNSVLAFAENLHSFGNKTGKNDIVVILEAMAQSTQAGDAIVAAMREGRNLAKLADASVSSDNKIDDQNAIVEPGNIS